MRSFYCFTFHSYSDSYFPSFIQSRIARLYEIMLNYFIKDSILKIKC